MYVLGISAVIAVNWIKFEKDRRPFLKKSILGFWLSVRSFFGRGRGKI